MTGPEIAELGKGINRQMHRLRTSVASVHHDCLVQLAEVVNNALARALEMHAPSVDPGGVNRMEPESTPSRRKSTKITSGDVPS
jgi:hypothetical protein